MRNGILAPSGRGLRPQAVGERALPLSEVSDDGKALSLSPLRGQLPRRGSQARGVEDAAPHTFISINEVTTYERLTA